MRFDFRLLELTKLYPLAISRGTMASSENLFVFVSDGVHTGVGEHSPATGSDWTAKRGMEQLKEFVESVLVSRESGVFAGEHSEHNHTSTRTTHFAAGTTAPHTVYQLMREREIDPPAMAALDTALWDLLAKQAGMPLYKMLGLPKTDVPTSVTIGINPPEVTRERVPDILRRTGAKCLKIKLGSPEGREHDQAHFCAAAEAAAPFHVQLRVDANGGWTIDEAIRMDAWLAGRGVDYIEQPLPEGQEEALAYMQHRRLPIFVDESCRFSEDIPKWAKYVDGVNLKLMKCGGITEAVRIVAVARAFGLKTMIGCMSESSVAIAAGASIGALFDHIDLDSHLNLNPDPCEGAPIEDGVVRPTDRPGHGASVVA